MLIGCSSLYIVLLRIIINFYLCLFICKQIYNLEIDLSNANQKIGNNTKYKKVIGCINNEYWYY